MSIDGTQLTIPAKQHKILRSPRRSMADWTADWTSASMVTLQGMVTMLALGKSCCTAEMCSLLFVRDVDRSRRARPCRPCSRSARAEVSARAPAPPVTIHCLSPVAFLFY